MPIPAYNQIMGQAPRSMPQPNPPMNFMQQLQQFAATIRGNPQEIVQNLLQSGKMSNEQYQQFSQIANQIVGIR